MIETGLSAWVLANPNIQPFLGQTSQEAEATPPKYSAFYYSFLPKEPSGLLPGLIFDRLKSPNAVDTLDRRTDAPGEAIEGRFQFRSVANDNKSNPKNYSGYLSCLLLSRALRRELTGLANGEDPTLPDGTIISNVFDWDEFDSPYELGGVGYLYGRALQVTIVFQEPLGS